MACDEKVKIPEACHATVIDLFEKFQACYGASERLARQGWMAERDMWTVIKAALPEVEFGDRPWKLNREDMEITR